MIGRAPETPTAKWDVLWSQVKEISLNDFDREIMLNLSRYVRFQARTVLELGCGRGILSRFALEHGAVSATLVDSSGEALRLARRVMAGLGAVEFVQADILDSRPERKFDIVLSSGVVEHFRGPALLDCLRVHADDAAELVVIVVPSTPHLNEYHCRTRRFVETTGYERPISAQRMRKLLAAAALDPVLVRRFFPLYNVSAYWTLPRTGIALLDRQLDRKFAKLDAWARKRGIRDRLIPPLRRLDPLFGGLLLAVARPR